MRCMWDLHQPHALVPWRVCSCPSVSEAVSPREAARCPGSRGRVAPGVPGPLGLVGASRRFLSDLNDLGNCVLFGRLCSEVFLGEGIARTDFL